MRRHRFVALAVLLACAAPPAITVQAPVVLAGGENDGGCWDLYRGLRADCDRRYQYYLDTCNGMEEPDRSHCFNGAEYWRGVCYQDAWWEFEGCIRS